MRYGDPSSLPPAQNIDGEPYPVAASDVARIHEPYHETSIIFRVATTTVRLVLAVVDEGRVSRVDDKLGFAVATASRAFPISNNNSGEKFSAGIHTVSKSLVRRPTVSPHPPD
ncbi:hypothetical protein [Paraburkholderia tropica]|uniref:hypothetical protein n=1 Tax=Paraburkholderia tropica TaxID=92647 RepID=UPI0016008D26|nr:hypothetical protein [Paraburkholderia tropica]